MMGSRWVCCQLGAREHYAVPRALYGRGLLQMLITDAWLRPGHLLAHVPGELPRRLAERWHPGLESASVHDLTLSLVGQEIIWRMRRQGGWNLLMARNEWFRRAAARTLSQYHPTSSEPVVVFAHSYAALEIFSLAKSRGWTTVLGQIDPGEEHFRIVSRLAEAAPQYGPAPAAPPRGYFAMWQQECALADHIVVNSEWSREAVIRAGVDARRTRVLPLAYEDADRAAVVERTYPEAFTQARPLRLLFVGSVAVSKGAASLLEAMTLLADLPVTLTLVGSGDMVIPSDLRQLPSTRFTGAVPRGDVAGYYRAHDVLVFPSHSDGFGMAQIEAQAAGLPIIASPYCGRVVADGVNGLVLTEVTPTSIAAAVRSLVRQPGLVAEFARHARASARPGLTALGAGLEELTAA